MMVQDFRIYLGKRFLESGVVDDFIANYFDEPEVNDEGDRTYCEYKSAGVSLVLNNSTVIETIQIFSSEPGYRCFEGRLPDDLTWTMTRSDVVKMLGEPTKLGMINRVLIHGVAPTWIRYDRPLYSIHVDFGVDDKGLQTLKSVTLMTADRAARLGLS